jgi:hypothetical protein
MKDATFEVDIKRRTYVISLDRDLYNKVRSLAEERGISTETLLNLWIQEKIS